MARHVACGLLVLAFAWRFGDSAASMALLAAGPAIGLIQASGPRWDGAFQLALLLLLLSLALQAFVLGRLTMDSHPTDANPPRGLSARKSVNA